jgi:iron complex transport system permease protein
MAGSLGALGLVFALAGWGKKQDVLRLLLSGVVVGSMLAAMTSLILIFGGKDTNVILRWLLGSLTPMSWERLAAMVVVIGSAFFLAWRRSRWLNAFGLSEELAGRLGVDARREMMVQVGAGSLAVGAIVGSAGIIGFIGLIAPHVARVWVGGDLRRSLVLSGLVGSGLLVLADLLAQKLWLGAELPVGSVTAVLGSPVLLWLLRRGVYRV